MLPSNPVVCSNCKNGLYYDIYSTGNMKHLKNGIYNFLLSGAMKINISICMQQIDKGLVKGINCENIFLFNFRFERVLIMINMSFDWLRRINQSFEINTFMLII